MPFGHRCAREGVPKGAQKWAYPLGRRVALFGPTTQDGFSGQTPKSGHFWALLGPHFGGLTRETILGTGQKGPILGSLGDPQKGRFGPKMALFGTPLNRGPGGYARVLAKMANIGTPRMAHFDPQMGPSGTPFWTPFWAKSAY